MQRSLEHELREALRLGRHRVGVEQDVAGFAVTSSTRQRQRLPTATAAISTS